MLLIDCWSVCIGELEDRRFDVDARIHFNLPIVNAGSLMLLTT